MEKAGHVSLVGEAIWKLPNFLTMMRVLFIPIIVIFLFFPGRTTSLVGALFFCLASFTDWLDGHLARRWNIVTNLGKFLDPLADKLLVIAPLIMLIPLGRVPAWMVVILVSREVAVTGLRGIASSEGIIISSSRLGKEKTTFQVLALIALLLHYEYYLFLPWRKKALSLDFHEIGMVFLWLALIFSTMSGVDYFKSFLGQALNTNSEVKKKQS